MWTGNERSGGFGNLSRSAYATEADHNGRWRLDFTLTCPSRLNRLLVAAVVGLAAKNQQSKTDVTKPEDVTDMCCLSSKSPIENWKSE